MDDQGELVVAAVHEVILGCVKRYQDELDLLGGNSKRRVSRTPKPACRRRLDETNTTETSMYQLNCRHVFFPPQKLLEAWSSSRQAIVEVHDNMDSGIYHGVERPHSTCSKQEKLQVRQRNPKITCLKRSESQRTFHSDTLS